MPVAMILVLVCRPVLFGIATMGPRMILVIIAHIAIRVSDSHITDIERNTNGRIGGAR